MTEIFLWRANSCAMVETSTLSFRVSPRAAAQVAEIAAIRALAVHAKTDAAAAFYRHFGFAPSPTDPRHLFMIVKDIRLAAGA